MSTETMSYLLKLASSPSSPKLIEDNRIHPGRPGSTLTPTTQTVSPYFSEGFGAAYTVTSTCSRTT